MEIQNYVGRNKLILDICRGQDTLHLGCIGFNDCDPNIKLQMANKSLHSRLSKEANCTGIDLDGATIDELKKSGIFDNVLEGNVEHLELFEGKLPQFDIVLAGDIIEHLSNPGLMLEGIKKFIKSDGTLVVSTPNSFGIAAYLRFLKGSFSEGKQHVMCFNSVTFQQILERHGYEVITAQSCYQDMTKKSNSGLFRFLKAILEYFPRLGGTLIYTCKLPS